MVFRKSDYRSEYSASLYPTIRKQIYGNSPYRWGMENYLAPAFLEGSGSLTITSLHSTEATFDVVISSDTALVQLPQFYYEGYEMVLSGDSSYQVKGIYVDGLESDSKYVFQYVKAVEIHNARITTKAAFWEVENVTVYDSVLDGEYLGWHSRNLRLINCHISGEQPLCYATDLVLENCTFDSSCDRAFEYSTLQADIRGSITNIKNPASGRIVADGIGSVTLDENIKAPADCEILLRSSDF